MVSLVKSLVDGGHSVLILALVQEPYEDSAGDLVYLINQDLDINAQVSDVLVRYAPDSVVIREALNENVASIVSKVSKTLKIKSISYEQNPCYASNFVSALYQGVRHFLYQTKRGLPLLEMSPKRGVVNGYRVPFRKYFRFPMELNGGGDKRRYFSQGIVRIVAVGKLGVERKRLHWVVDALESSHVNYLLTLIGANDISRYPGRSLEYYKNLYDRTSAARAIGKIRILENVPYRKMANIYEDSDIFVLPSKGEKFGISPLEAMSHGCAVLCPDDNGSTAYLTQAYDAIIFDSKDYNDFRTKLLSLSNDVNQVTELGTNALTTIKEKHSLYEFLTFYNKLMSDYSDYDK
jgi:glycosyltransferase involved in cell wall biosynthesis